MSMTVDFKKPKIKVGKLRLTGITLGLYWGILGKGGSLFVVQLFAGTIKGYNFITHTKQNELNM